MPESSIAPFLTTLQERVRKEMIRVGSCASLACCLILYGRPRLITLSRRAADPKLMQGVDVSLIGKDEPRLKELAQEVIQELKGELVAQGKLGQESKA